MLNQPNTPGFGMSPNLRGVKQANAMSPQLRPEVNVSPQTASKVMMSKSNTGAKKKTRKRESNKRIANDIPVYIPDAFSSDSSSSSDSFNKEVNRTIFFDDNRRAPVKFDIAVSDTTLIMPLQTVTADYAETGEDASRFMVNLARYHKPTNGSVPSIAGYPAYDHLNTIFVQMSKTVLATVRSKIVDEFSFPNFYNYMQNVTQALEVYYTLDSLLSYTSDTDDKNSGVIDVQQLLTEVDIFSAKNELLRALKGYWFPENYSQLIRWTYQVYKTSDNKQALNYMFFPSNDFIYSSTTERNAVATTVKDKVDALVATLTRGTNTLMYSKIASILGQVYPEGIIRGLPLSCNTSSYDPIHYEIFVNQPVYFTEGTVDTYYPSAGTSASPADVCYARACDPGQQSGFAFTMQSLITTDGYGGIEFFEAFRNNTTTAIHKTNKFFMFVSSNKYYFGGRNSYNAPHETADVHTVMTNSVNEAGTIHKLSCPKSGYQRVFFDSVRAPLINLREMMDKLYNVLP